MTVVTRPTGSKPMARPPPLALFSPDEGDDKKGEVDCGAGESLKTAEAAADDEADDMGTLSLVDAVETTPS